ncbi:MAG TPA: hypothetical protein PK637_13290 [Flavobacteriales bacterium]|nr:hypothetical protein [Flavobacteriales bacterium]
MDRTKDTLGEIIQRDIIVNTDAIWKCAHRYLWNKYPFSQREINSAKNHIKKYFEEILPALYFNFEKQKVQEFALRILLAADYVKRKSGRFIPHPVIWFNPENPHGFTGTKSWYERRIENERYKNMRFYHQDGILLCKEIIHQ